MEERRAIGKKSTNSVIETRNYPERFLLFYLASLDLLARSFFWGGRASLSPPPPPPILLVTKVSDDNGEARHTVDSKRRLVREIAKFTFIIDQVLEERREEREREREGEGG